MGSLNQRVLQSVPQFLLRSLRQLTVTVLLMSPLHFAQAGSACEVKKTGATVFIKAMQLAEKTRAALEQSGAQVALIARVGQDLSKYQLRYSHMAYVWRDHPKGRWMVVHELNQCGTAHSTLFDEGLGNFFLDDLFAYESTVLIPGPDSQAKIVAMLASPVARQLHDNRYNMLAYVFGDRYQNSNQWVLETYAAASASDVAISSRKQAQDWMKMAGYKPLTLYVPTVTRLGGRMFRANIAFDDHPAGRRLTGQIDTATVESVLRFVRARDSGAREIMVTLD